MHSKYVLKIIKYEFFAKKIQSMLKKINFTFKYQNIKFYYNLYVRVQVYILLEITKYSFFCYMDRNIDS